MADDDSLRTGPHVGSGPRIRSRAVPFAGPGAGAGPLTWGQQHIWEVMQDTDSSRAMGAVVPLTDGKDVDELASELAFFMARYESMRTRLRIAADGTPVQEVAAAGEAELRVVEVPDDADPAAVAEALSEDWQATKFDYEGEWPMRMAAVRHRGAATHVVVCLSHLAADGAGVGVMMRELGERNMETGEARNAQTAISPIELAEWQSGPAGQRASGASLRHWERVLREVPLARFAGPPNADRPEPRFRQATFTSAALRTASRIVAAALGTAVDSVILGAYAYVLAGISGVEPVVIQGVVDNRFRPGLADASHPLCQNGIFAVEVGDASLAEVVERTRRASMQAAKYAYFDPKRQKELLARVAGERGGAVGIGCLFNARSRSGPLDAEALGAERSAAAGVAAGAAVARLREAAAERVLTWGPPLADFQDVMITFDEFDDAAALLVEADTWRVSVQQMEELVRGIEEVVIEAVASEL
ncbi:condensation domain-containing protein [Catenulispora yoronensis]